MIAIEQINIKNNNTQYTLNLNTCYITGVIFEDTGLLDAFVELLVRYKQGNVLYLIESSHRIYTPNNICIAIMGYDVLDNQTLTKYIRADMKKIGIEIKQYIDIHKKVNTYTPFELAIARILVAAQQAQLIFIDRLFNMLTTDEMCTVVRFLKEVQQHYHCHIIPLITDQVYGVDIEQLYAKVEDGHSLLPIKIHEM